MADESLHHRLGGLYFEWASEQMEDAERARLAKVAMETLKSLSPLWNRRRTEPSSARYRATIEQIRTIGWIESRVFKDQVKIAIHDGIVKPLATYGIELPREEVDALLA